MVNTNTLTVYESQLMYIVIEPIQVKSKTK